ncbi:MULTISPECIES: glycoside hydrolase family 13 protein [unclassified Rathayibacter]|uniref:glycoside hydrolase family 13 protein n=1 Tax=unclassified Rathayibacter TaxID=2609250 RepID=UPI00188CB792|nr:MULTISPECIES: alpha-glucosidase [unclassified Rathayibacter]MBF4463556.1 alpha-glucosidase [Rathayibacter sp. VKM Ac-2879]MBF4504994.1 alpha-glucosidase [Rathayibacter sp. VKM Ac-2878]
MEPDAASPSTPWWTSAVVYQIYPRSFADSNGDGIGDLGGIRSKLDHLADLGVDVIWLSPLYPSPQHDNGYDISDYDDIDPRFGTLAEFELFVAEAHERGIRILMDLVVNHTSDEHAWFVQSRSSQEDAKRDWYWWRRGRASAEPGRELEAAASAGIDGTEPNGWRSYFSGPAWTLDPATDEYFLHLFAVQQPDLNWENPEVRHAVHAMMNRWLDRGVDGFRMDVINLISKNLDEIDGAGGGAGIVEGVGPRLHEFLREMNEAVFAGREGSFLTVGEMPGVTLEEAILVTDPERHELDMVFQFEHVALDHGVDKFHPVPLDLVALKANLARWQDGLAERGWNSLYLGNHDQPRLVSRFGDDGAWRYESATLWATLLHLQRGTPYIYQGDEIGMTNVPFAGIDDFRDVESLNYYAEAVGERGEDPEVVLAGLRAQSRDNARTPVQWDDGPEAGFTTGEPWIAVTPNASVVNVAADRAAERSVFEYYRALIALRHDDKTVQLGRFALLEPEHTTLFAFTRTGADELLVVGNVSGDPLEVALLDDWAGAETVLGNVPGASGSSLGPWEARVLRR